jgi:hypothetical protein
MNKSQSSGSIVNSGNLSGKGIVMTAGRNSVFKINAQE